MCYGYSQSTAFARHWKIHSVLSSWKEVIKPSGGVGYETSADVRVTNWKRNLKWILAFIQLIKMTDFFKTFNGAYNWVPIACIVFKWESCLNFKWFSCSSHIQDLQYLEISTMQRWTIEQHARAMEAYFRMVQTKMRFRPLQHFWSI